MTLQDRLIRFVSWFFTCLELETVVGVVMKQSTMIGGKNIEGATASSNVKTLGNTEIKIPEGCKALCNCECVK